MEEYQLRVIEEYAELDVKLTALDAFIAEDRFDALPERDKQLLEDQARAMASYGRILHSRIRRFHDNEGSD